MDPSPFKRAIATFYESTTNNIDQLVTDLYTLDLDQVRNDEQNKIEVLLNTIKGFGQDTLEKGVLTNRQCARVRKVIEKYLGKPRATYKVTGEIPSSVPPVGVGTTIPYRNNRTIDLDLLSDQALALVMNLISALQSDRLSSGLTMPVLEYFELLAVLSEDDPEVKDHLDLVSQILKKHGWTSGGFTGPPNQDQLVADLRALLG